MFGAVMRTRTDWLGWAACAFALAVTFAAEYELARAVGINETVALAVPGALDVYVLRALQVRRDVLGAVIAMVLVNAASHLVTAGVLVADWPLIVAVSAVAPLVLWRAHVLRHRKHTASTEPDTEHGRAPDDTDGPGTREHPEHSVPLWDDSFPDDLPVLVGHEERWPEPEGTGCVCEHGPGEHNEHGCYSPLCPCRAPRRTPTESHPGHGRDYGARVPTVDEHAAEVIDLCSEPVNGPEHVSAPVLKLVPALGENDPLLRQARVLMIRNGGTVPTVRALKKELSVGTPRAQRIRDVLVTEAREAQKKGTES